MRYIGRIITIDKTKTQGYCFNQMFMCDITVCDDRLENLLDNQLQKKTCVTVCLYVK